MLRQFRLWMVLPLVAVLPVSATAQSITSTSPLAVAPGKPTDLKIRGGALNGPTQFWSNLKADAVLPPEIAGNGTNAAEITYRLTVPADAGPGVYGIRVATAAGVSNLRLIAVDELASVAQVRGNHTLDKAQVVTLPTAVDGYVDNLSKDFYKFTVTAGQRVAIEVLGRRLGSPIDSIIVVRDAKGRELAYNDDAAGLGPDSRLAYVFKEAGECTVEVRDIRFQGSGAHLYRLRLGDFPLVTVPFPMAVTKGASASLGFASVDANVQPVAFNLPADFPQSWLNVGGKLPGGVSSGFGLAEVVAVPQAAEVEPNNDQPMATRVPFGAGINGRIDQPGDVDRFIFTAKTGQHVVFQGITRSVGAPTDLDFALLKADGAQVAAAEDAGMAEGAIDYTFPADGDYTLVVRDIRRFGGPEYAYRISADPFVQTFSLSASADTVNVAAGGLAAITVNTVRGPFAGPIVLSLVDAPEGMVATPTVIGPGMVTTVLTIQCAPTVAPGKIYNVRIQGTSQVGEAVTKVIATVTDAQKVAFSGLQVPPPALSQTVAIGVNPAPLFTLKTSAPEITFGKDLSATVKVIATRAAGFDDEIVIAVTAVPPTNAVPPGVTVAVKNIPKGMNEVDIVYTAANAAPLGAFSTVVQGTGKGVIQPIPSLTLNLSAPFALKPDLGTALLAKGQTLKGKVIATRNPAYAGPIVLTFQNLPKGVTAAAATIAAGQTEVEVVLTAAADAAVGAVANVIVAGEGLNGAAKLPASSPATTLTVQ